MLSHGVLVPDCSGARIQGYHVVGDVLRTHRQGNGSPEGTCLAYRYRSDVENGRCRLPERATLPPGRLGETLRVGVMTGNPDIVGHCILS